MSGEWEKVMTPEQVQIVRLTFVQIMTDKDQTGRLFYDRLFAIAPEVKPLFKGDMDAQSRKLMDTLALAIGMIRDIPTLKSTLEALAQRHVAYGVRDEHYDKVGEALLWTLQQILGPAFTPHARGAWSALYDAMVRIMRDAAAGKGSLPPVAGPAVA
jgi:nitric oxide dioxygenase